MKKIRILCFSTRNILRVFLNFDTAFVFFLKESNKELLDILSFHLTNIIQYSSTNL